MARAKYLLNMKKIFCPAIVALVAALITFTACGGGIDYSDFISERRVQVYLYEDDSISVKVHISSRESPYLSDGYKGEMQELCEVFVTFADSPDSVTAKIGESGGEMSYMSVSDSFYLSFTGSDLGDSAQVELTYGEETRQITAPSALYDGVITCEEALESARQYDSELFLSLTDGNNFEGEIYVRLLADEGKCYYYVGVIDREGNTAAYLVDGVNGNVIAERKL